MNENTREEIDKVVDEVIAKHHDLAVCHRNGKTFGIAVFVGGVHKATNGKYCNNHDSSLLNEIIYEKLAAIEPAKCKHFEKE